MVRVFQTYMLQFATSFGSSLGLSRKKGGIDINLRPCSFRTLLRRFHRIARQLKHRHNERSAFSIQDEYDVQDLLHAILRGLFDDVRPEEYAPSYAGSASRMDFLLKSEQIVLEAKFSGPSLRDKQIGEQLMSQTSSDIKLIQIVSG